MSAVWDAIPAPDRKGLRSFGLTTGTLVAALFGLAVPWLLGRPIPWWPWALCLALVSWAWLAPSSLRGLYTVWMGFGLVMNRATTPLILGITFFLVLTPVGRMRALLRRDALARRLDADRSTYRVASKKQPFRNMERPF